MTADLDPRDPLAERLHALGRQPVDTALQSEHLTAMAGVRTGSAFRTSLAGRLKVGAGVLAGVLIGATGLTTAGAMGPLQPIASTAVRAATPFEAPHGKSADAKAKHADKAGDEAGDKGADSASRLEDGSIGTARQWDGCTPGEDGKFAGNRGLYLKQIRENGTAEELQAAKDSDCGKPVADDGDQATDDEKTVAPETSDTEDGDHGKPADPGAAGKAKADENKGGDHGKSADAGPPSSVPAPEAQDHADDSAELPTPSATPGEHTPGDDA